MGTTILCIVVAMVAGSLGVIVSALCWAAKGDPAREAAADSIGYAPEDIRWDATAGEWVPKPGRQPQRIGAEHTGEPLPLVAIPPPPAPEGQLTTALEACRVKHEALWEVQQAIGPLQATVTDAIAACPTEEEPQRECQETPLDT